jgi:tyrosinase
MYDLYASSFDPVFFLHHANVDRLWAIWAAIHPDTYFQQRTCYSGTYSTRPGTIENETNPLYPFRKDTNGGYHTSQSMRNVKDLGYAYEEIPDWQFNSKDDLANHVLDVVDRLYGQVSVNKAADTSGPKVQTPTRRWMLDFTVTIDSGTAAIVYFFYGTPPAQRDKWTTENNLVVAQAFLASHISMPRSARIPITTYLNKAISEHKLEDLSSKSVESFLSANLQWRVIAQGSSVASNMQFDRQISVKVVDQKVVGITKGLTQYGPATVHGKLTWTSKQDY